MPSRIPGISSLAALAAAVLSIAVVPGLAAEINGEPAPVRLDPAVERMWIDQLEPARQVERRQTAPLVLAHHTANGRRGTTGADIVYGPQKQDARRTARRGEARAKPKRLIDPVYLPAMVDFGQSYAPGTIVIDTRSRFLYLVMEDGKARRYGVGVGRTGFGWTGEVNIGRKAEWPGWTPPPEMRKRQPGLPEHMEGGVDNPLGARALYLYRGGRDTIYRIHGSNEPWTIGQAVSSGCFRMRNEDVTDLYERVGVGTRVVVL
jgi:lipoprotein-anchoring transpeptidase ErfK/SrfK